MTKGFVGVRCPLCGEEDSVHVRIADVNDFSCSQCNEQFSGEDLREWCRRWEALLAGRHRLR